MPTGAHWTLRYEPTVDDRIQARVDANLLRRDEFVQSVEIQGARTSYILEVQFYDDRDGPYDRQLQQLERRQPLPPASPPEAIPHRTLDETLTEYLRTPITSREVIQRWNRSIRQRRDYTSVSRRTFLVENLSDTVPVFDPPYGATINAQFGTAIHHSQEEVIRDREEVSQLVTQGLGITSELLTGVPMEAPTWLAVGAWVQHRNGNFAEVSEVEMTYSCVVTRVHVKLWRARTLVQSLPLPDFLKYWTPCAKPPEPLTRYESIRRGF